MNLTGYLVPGGIILHLRGATHDEVIHELVDVASSGSERLKRELLKSVYDVEDIRNTAVGRGVAIPHGRTDAVPRLMLVFGRSDKGVEWGAPDGKAVRLVWLVLNPLGEAESYLEVLAQITRLCVRKRSRDAIIRARTSEDILLLLSEEPQVRRRARRGVRSR